MPTKINIDLPSSIKFDKSTYQKMIFIINTLEKGWTIKKKDDTYIFTKKHENRREIFQESYLENFIQKNNAL
jgi:hypothetical protein|tara:strand:+ start:238 stop:453 length:216 start_codon:yes stop_codon:yes gene_type:complete